MLQEGVEVALRTDPDVLERCKPKTGAGRYARAMVLEAGKGKMTAMKTVLSLLDWEPDENDPQTSEEMFHDTDWDWSPDGVWLTMPEVEPEKPIERSPKARREKDDFADDRWPDGAQAELERRLKLLMSGNEADQARAQVIIAKMKAEAAEDEAAEANQGLERNGSGKAWRANSPSP
jgi:dipeptidyl aminopeptidase/acylaminoacyl peptidase